MRRRILVADDSSTIQKVIKIAFARFGVEMVEAGSLIEALAAVGQRIPDALIIDASLPGTRGPQDFIKLRADAQGAPVLLLVGTYEAVDEAAFGQAGFAHVLKKPFESGDIVAAIERLLGTALDAPASTPEVSAPLVPPLPGSQDRSRHATVVHSGGLPGLAEFSLEERAPARTTASPLPPPPPLAEEGRKGRRVFGSEAAGNKPPPPTVIGAASQAVPPPPLSLNLDDFDDEPGDDEPTLVRGNPAARSGRQAMPPARPPAPPIRPSTMPPPVILDEEAASGPLAAELPALVRQAVEDYCERHFKSLAREVIAAELMRLADEKARHLVDN